MASSPITSWETDEEKVEIVTNFIFLGSKIAVDGDCSHEIKDACSLEEKLWPIQWKLSAEELMLLNSGVGEDSWEPLGLQDQTS